MGKIGFREVRRRINGGGGLNKNWGGGTYLFQGGISMVMLCMFVLSIVCLVITMHWLGRFRVSSRGF